MEKEQKKKPAQWKNILINALADLIVGLILLIIDKLIG